MRSRESVGIHLMFVFISWFLFLFVSKVGAVHQSYFGYYYIYEIFAWIALGIAFFSVVLFINEVRKTK